MREVIYRCDRCGNIMPSVGRIGDYSLIRHKSEYEGDSEEVELCNQCLESLKLWMSSTVAWLSEGVDDGK